MQSASEESVIVRAALVEDVGTLVEFNRKMALETEGKHLDVGTLKLGILGVLEDGTRGRYYLAEQDGRAVGCLMFTTEWSDWRNGWFWWIQSVFVEGAQRRQGIFRRLYTEVIDLARQTPSVAGVRLYVDADNTGAQSVYRAVGMSKSHYLMYELEF